MSDKKKVFLDTNLLIYRSFGTRAQKESILNIITGYQGRTYISTQVLNEFINVTIKKKFFESDTELSETLSYFISNLNVTPITTDTVLQANFLRSKYKLSYYDCVIVAAAMLNNCQILYSEDMQHNLTIEKKLKIVNPFK